MVDCFPLFIHGSGVGGKMSDFDSDLSKTSDTDSRLLNITFMKFGCQQFCKSLTMLSFNVESLDLLMDCTV